MVSKEEWDALSPLNKMQNAIQLAGYHYITCLKAAGGNQNCELTVKGRNYSFEAIRTFDNSTLIWEFQSWASRNVMRDLVESFSTLMTEVYRTLESKSTRALPINSAKFEMLGINDQSQTFKANFNIDDRWFAMFDGFNRARNCLAHRQGVVSSKDVNDIDALIVRWLGTGLSVANRVPTQFVEVAGMYSDLIRGEETLGGLAVDFRVDVIQKRVNTGEVLVFEPEEILQICQTFQLLASVFSRVVR